MAWVRFDDKRSVNGKLRRAGFAARGLDEAAICWSAHEEDDGFISVDDVNMLASMHGCRKVAPVVAKLIEVERWEAMEVMGELKGYLIKDFLDYNPSHADLEAQRQRDRERKRKPKGSGTDSGGIPDGSHQEA